MVAAKALTAWKNGDPGPRAELGAVLFAEGLEHLRIIASALGRKA